MNKLARFNVSKWGPAVAKSAEKVTKVIPRWMLMPKARAFIKLVLTDYKNVAIETGKDMRAKPAKSVCYVAGLAFLGLLYKQNPDQRSFRAKFVESANRVALIPPTLVNPRSMNHVLYLQDCYNRGLIRHTSCGLFSIVWEAKYSQQCNIYETSCSYLQVPYLRFPWRIVDVGFLNIWWRTSRQMLDYDVNYL